MKKITLLILAFVFINATYSQTWKGKVPSRIDSEERLNFYEIQKEFNSHWDKYNVKNGKYTVNGKELKAPGWKQFKRWEWFWETRIDRLTGEMPSTNLYEIQQDYTKMYNAKADQANWESVGPDNSDGGYAGVGRINCITFHPTNKNIFWAGTPSGGLWKTENAGSTWTCLTDDLPIIGVSDIVLANDYETSKTLYISTGDRDGKDNYSIGVMKSTDDGLTWDNTGLSWTIGESGNAIINKFMKNPNNSDVLYAGYNGRIRKTIDAGNNWSVILEGYIFDMDLKPNCEDTTVYAARYNYDNTNTEFVKSSDGGANWITTHTFNSNVYRVDLAVSEADSTVVYALACNNNGGLEGVYKSVNSGLSFSKVFNGNVDGNNLLGYWSDGRYDPIDGNVGQGWYDLTIVVSPADENTLFVGGINTWKSTDGGANWEINNMWTSYSGYNLVGAPEVHADKHYLIYQDENTLFEGNDGGIYKTVNGGATWTDLTNGMVISQIYKLGVSQTAKGDVITGLQDNGSKLYYSNDWYDVKGGDGMECIIDYTDNNVQYATYVGGQIDRTLDLWNSYPVDITDETRFPNGNTGAWVSPYVLNPQNSKAIYLGYEDLYKSINRGNSWKKITNLNLTNDIRVIEISETDTNIIYITDHNSLYKTDNGGNTWTNISGSLPSTTSALTSIEINSKDKNNLWITFGGYNNTIVYESKNGGSSWTDISAGLPSVPASTIIHNNRSKETQLYIGTDLGVYVKNGTSNWEAFNANLPSVIVTELEIYYDESNVFNSVLYAATYGRGLWKSELASFTLQEIIVDEISGLYTVSDDSVAALTVNYDINESFTSNTFNAYLSDKDGLFDNEVLIGFLTSDLKGSIEAEIPASTVSGTNYKVRIKSTNPVYESEASNSFEIILDTVSPMAMISSSYVNYTTSNPFDINISFEEQVVGFEKEDIIVSNASVGNLDVINSLSYKLSLMPTATGQITVDIPVGGFKDVIGNQNLASNQWVINYYPTGINELEFYSIKIFPNPTNGKLSIENKGNANISEIGVYDISGRKVYQEFVNNKRIINLDLEDVSKGVYLLHIKVDGKNITSKLIIE